MKKIIEETTSSRPRSPNPNNEHQPIFENFTMATNRSVHRSRNRKYSKSNKTMTVRSGSKTDMSKVRAKVDSGITRDINGKVRLKEDPIKILAR